MSLHHEAHGLQTHTVVGAITLLGLVAQPAGFVRACGAWGAVQGGQLPVLPAAHTQQEPHHVRLLLPPELLDVLVGTHVCLPAEWRAQ